MVVVVHTPSADLSGIGLQAADVNATSSIVTVTPLMFGAGK